MKEGLIEQLDVPREIYRRPATEFAANFIGRANMVRGSLDATGLTLAGEGGVSVVATEPGIPGSASTAVFRSEDVVVGADAAKLENRWTATVDRVAFLGRHLDLALRLPSGALRAEVRTDLAVQHGDEIQIGVPASAVHFVPTEAAG